MQEHSPDPKGRKGNPIYNEQIALNNGLARPVNPYQFPFRRSAQSIPKPIAVDQPQNNIQQKPVNQADIINIDHSMLDELGHPVNRDPKHLDMVMKSIDALGL